MSETLEIGNALITEMIINTLPIPFKDKENYIPNIIVEFSNGRRFSLTIDGELSEWKVDDRKRWVILNSVTRMSKGKEVKKNGRHCQIN